MKENGSGELQALPFTSLHFGLQYSLLAAKIRPVTLHLGHRMHRCYTGLLAFAAIDSLHPKAKGGSVRVWVKRNFIAVLLDCWNSEYCAYLWPWLGRCERLRY